MAIFGRRYQPPEDPGEHIRYMEEQLEFFGRQMEKRLGELEMALPAAKEELREGLLELSGQLGTLEEQLTETKNRAAELEDRVTELEKEWENSKTTK